MFPIINILNIKMPSFFLVICLGLIVCLLFTKYRLDHWMRHYFWIEDQFKKNVWQISLLLMIFGFIGARLLHIVFEEPEYYVKFPERVFFIWQGGFVYYGGFILGILAGLIFLFLRRVKHKLLYFDFFAPIASLGYLIGRVGCFLNGCCYGKTCDLPWAMTMIDDNGLYFPRHPTQLYFVFSEFLILMLLFIVEKNKRFYFHRDRRHRETQFGVYFMFWLSFHSFSRFVIESYRDDFRGTVWLFPISSWISLVLLVVSTRFLFRRKKHLIE